MNFTLTAEQESIYQHISTFAKKELNKGVIERDEKQEFSNELWRKCGEQKLLGLPVNEIYGGAELDALSTIITLESLGFGSEDGGLNFAIGAHLLAGVVPLWKFGSQQQKKLLLSNLCNGTKIAANAMTEVNAGSDVFSMKTNAKKSGNGYVINGIKTFCSNGSIADVFVVFALTDESKGFFGGITAFLVNKSSKGVKIGQKFDKMGLRTCPICEVIFEDVFVDENSILGGIGGGASVFNAAMEWERIGLAAIHVGTMKRLLNKALEYAKARQINNESLIKKQNIAHRLAEIKVKIEAASLLTYKAASNIGVDKNNMINASIAKLYVSETLINVATEVMNLFGGNGYMRDYGIERILRDAHGSTIYSGTSDIQKNIIAKLL